MTEHVPLSGPEIADVKKRIVRGTAEFVWRYKKQLHTRGRFTLHLPAGGEVPLWLRLVLDELRLRRGRWQVQVGNGRRRETLFTVRWLGFLKNAKGRRR